MGFKKRTPIDIGDAVVASKLAPKKRRIESPKLRDSLSPPPQSSSVASQTRASSQVRTTLSSAAEKTPERVIVLDSPPSSDQDDEESRQDESASRQDDDLGTPQRDALPAQGEEFLTSRDDGPSFDQRRNGGPEEGGSSRRPGEDPFDDDEKMSLYSEAGGSVLESNPGAKDDVEVPKTEPGSCNPNVVKTW
ncbi:unnamed protein product [Microthlaspi erraticum]|uniref:Uncharacterized protein n=1 Tax=Microthlaspi erraticum TaxID=1685480 RepID=A0A6D2I5S1_9BRAS|nr:unnamed protein product [Microthlaspi erraticum]